MDAPLRDASPGPDGGPGRTIESKREHIMVEKHLDAIRAKEVEARERLEATAKEAEIILEKARAEGEKLIEDTKISGNELRRSKMAGAKQEAEKEIEALRGESAEVSTALGEVAVRNRDKALELIIRTFRQGI